jgi:hypothetical protein
VWIKVEKGSQMSIHKEIGEVLMKYCPDFQVDKRRIEATSAIIEIIRKGMPKKIKRSYRDMSDSVAYEQSAIDESYNDAITEFEKMLAL